MPSALPAITSPKHSCIGACSGQKRANVLTQLMMIQSRRENPVSDCPLTAALAAVGGKWKLIIIYSLAERPYHFAGIQQFLPDVSRKVLTEQLGELIADEIIEREETGPVPARVMYSLSAYGETLLPLIEVVNAWGRTHISHFAE